MRMNYDNYGKTQNRNVQKLAKVRYVIRELKY